jgi:MFS family permease
MKAIPLQLENLALISAALGMLAYSLDTAATQVGLPAIQASLEMTAVASQWVFNLPIMIIAALVGVGGWLGDRKGRVRFFLLGLLIFALATIGAIVSGLINSASLLMLSRALSGLGVAVFLPATSALVVEIYPLEQRGKALGTIFSITMLVTALGPTLAGFIVERFGWPWIYVPALLAALLAMPFLLKIKLPVPQHAGKFDFTGALLLALGVSATIFGLMQAGAWGWDDSRVLLALASGILLLLAFVFVERKKQDPLFQLEIFRNRSVMVSGLIRTFSYLPMVLGGIFVVRYVQEVLGLSAAVAGMTAIVTTGTAFLLAGVAGKQFDRRGARLTLSIAMATALIGSVVLGMGFGQESLLLILASLLFIGAGIAFANTSNTEALNNAPANLRGTTSALFNTLGQFGNAFSVAILTSITVMAESRQVSRTLGGLGATPEQINQAQLILAEASQGDVSRLYAIPADRLTPFLEIVRSASAAALQNTAFLVAGAMLVLLLLALAIPKRPAEKKEQKTEDMREVKS